METAEFDETKIQLFSDMKEKFFTFSNCISAKLLKYGLK